MARSWQKDAQVAKHVEAHFLSQAPSLGERCRCTWSLKALNAILLPSNFSRICMHFSKTNSYLSAVSLVQGLRDRGWGAFSGLQTVSLVVPSCSINKCDVDKWNGAFSSALGAWNPHIDLKNGKPRIDFMSTYDSVHPNLNVWSQPKAGQQGTKGVDNSIPCVTAPTRARSCVSLECKTGLIKSSSRSNLCHVSLSVALKYLKNNENYPLSLWSG